MDPDQIVAAVRKAKDSPNWDVCLEAPRTFGGKRRRRRRGGYHTEMEAWEAARGLSEQFAADLDRTVQDPTATVQTWCDTWVDRRQHTVARNTTDNYRYLLGTAYPHIGQMKLSVLSCADLELMRDRMLQDRPPLHVRAVLRSLRAALNGAVADGVLPQNPASRVSPPAVEDREYVTLSRTEVAALLRGVKNTDTEGPVTMMVLAGLRRGEALGMQWADIRPSRDRPELLTVQRQVRMVGNRIEEAAPKTKTSKRSIQLYGPTTEAVAKAWRWQQQYGVETRWVWADPTDPTRPVNHEKVRQAVKQFVPDGCRLHDLRHTCATLLLEAGENPKVVQELLGHASIATTLDLYGHVTPAMHSQAVRTMAEIAESA